MKPIYLLSFLFCLIRLQVISQIEEPPCAFSGMMQYAICIDFAGCIVLTPKISKGQEPYTYLWSDGSMGTYLRFGAPNYPNKCYTVTITDGKGCKTILAGNPFTESNIYDSTFLISDTFIANGISLNFNLAINDNSLAQGFTLVQPPRHGSVLINPDGTGQYIRDTSWCGLDYFRYTATDTSLCALARTATVIIKNGPCGAIHFTHAVCNGLCNGEAVFYQEGALTPPLNYLWSNGNTQNSSSNLCSGAISVTVTDALGIVKSFNSIIPEGTLHVSIISPKENCASDPIHLSPLLNVLPVTDSIYFNWSGQGIYMTTLKNQNGYSGSKNNDSNFISTYKLIVKSSSGCLDSNEVNINIFPYIEFKDIKLEGLECPNNTMTLTPDIDKGKPPYSFYWSGPHGIRSNQEILVWPNISKKENGRFTLLVSDQNGCQASNIQFIDVPDSCVADIFAYLIDSSEIYCQGSNVHLGIASHSFVFNYDLIQAEWFGPNGYYSTELEPFLKNVQINQSGVYKLIVYYRHNIYTSTVNLKISGISSDVLSVDVTPAKACYFKPGEISIQMSSPPPYNAYIDINGPYIENYVNPMKITSVFPGHSDVFIKKNGCSTLLSIDMPYPDEPQLITQDETCAGNDGSAILVSSNKIRAYWSIPDVQKTIPEGKSANNLNPSNYVVNIYDTSTYCTIKKSFTIKSYLDFKINVLDTPSCIDNTGTLEAIATGKINPPLKYSWSNQFIGNPNKNLAYGPYSVTLTDVDGCFKHKNVTLPAKDACGAYITGHVYLNYDCICTADSNSIYFPYANVCISDGLHKICSFTDLNGYYHIPLITPGDYTIDVTTSKPYFKDACVSKNINITNKNEVISGLDFFFCADSITDLSLSMDCYGFRPMTENRIYFNVYNNGTIPNQNALLTVQLDTHLIFSHASPANGIYDMQKHQVSWILPKLGVFESIKLIIFTLVLGNIGDTVRNEAIVTSVNNEVYLSDNKDYCQSIISNSYDPNIKTVKPEGSDKGKEISRTDSVLTYTIHFQNTGNDVAFDILVKDTLNADLFDLDKLSILNSSHPFDVSLLKGNILIFEFKNINLPDSSKSNFGSQGYVTFSIPLKKELPPGTLIKNTASIYFDYNLPVITNQVVNTITGVNNYLESSSTLKIYPNPSNTYFNIQFDSPTSLKFIKLEIYSLEGKLIDKRTDLRKPITGNSFITYDANKLSRGLYLIRLQTNKGNFFGKVIINK